MKIKTEGSSALKSGETPHMLINMEKKIKNKNKLYEYMQLEDNWDSDGAKSFSKKLIDLAWKKIEQLEIQPQVSPTMRESIQFEYEKENGDYLEFEIYENKIEVFRIINGDEEEIRCIISKNLNGFVNEFYNV